MRDYVKGLIHAARFVDLSSNTGRALVKEAQNIHLEHARFEFERAVYGHKHEIVEAKVA